jgi:hypothetical protein
MNNYTPLIIMFPVKTFDHRQYRCLRSIHWSLGTLPMLLYCRTAGLSAPYMVLKLNEAAIVTIGANSSPSSGDRIVVPRFD